MQEPGRPEAERGGSAPPTSGVPAPPASHRRQPLPSDLFAHSLGLSPANTPAPAGSPAAAEPDPPRPRRARRRRGRRRPLIAAVAVVALAAGGTAIGFAVTGDDPAPSVAASGSPVPSGSPTATTAVGAAAAWLTAYVRAPRQVLATGAQLTQDLRTAGVDVATLDVDDQVPLGAFVVRVSSSDPTPGAVSAVVPTGRSLVPLARFENGGDAVTVGQVVKGTPTTVEADLTAAAGVAAAACDGLAANAAVTVASGVASVFEAGDVDVRASTLVAVLARTQRVEVLAAPQDPAEQAAGRPVRSLVVRVEDTAALRTAAAAARPPYIATVEDPPAGLDVPAGSVLLTWLPNAAAALPAD